MRPSPVSTPYAALLLGPVNGFPTRCSLAASYRRTPPALPVATSVRPSGPNCRPATYPSTALIGAPSGRPVTEDQKRRNPVSAPVTRVPSSGETAIPVTGPPPASTLRITRP